MVDPCNVDKKKTIIVTKAANINSLQTKIKQVTCSHFGSQANKPQSYQSVWENSILPPHLTIVNRESVKRFSQDTCLIRPVMPMQL